MPKLQPSSRQRRTWARIAWAMPCSLIGAAAGLAVLALGGSVRREQGVLEFALPADRGGRLRLRTRWAAITFGHVVLAASPAELTRVRDHEHVHVRQYERLGPFFLVAYPLASLAAWWRGGQAYRDNRFEIQAREGSAAAADGPPGGPAEAGGRPQPFC